MTAEQYLAPEPNRPRRPHAPVTLRHGLYAAPVRRALPTAALAIALLASAAPAQAATSYCSPTGDYCTTVAKAKRAPVLRLVTFSYRGKVRVCVKPPRGRGTCKRFPLRKRENGIYVSSVRWGKQYPRRGRGLYRVRWQKNGNQLGRPLTFRR